MPSARLRIPKAAIPALLLLALTLGANAQFVETRIEVQGRFVGSMCYNSRKDAVYGSSQSGDFLFAVDCSSNQVISRVGVYFPRYWAYDSIDNKAYLSHRGRGGECDSVLVLNGATHTQTGSIPLDWANFLFWDPSANRLYVSCLEENRVSVIDCAADTVIKHIQTPAGPMRMHLNSRYRKLYVQCHDSQRLCIIDLRTLQIAKTLTLPGNPEAGCYSEAADKYYCGALHDVVVVDGATDSVAAQIGLPDRVISMVAVDRHSLVVVGATHASFDSVYVISAQADSVVKSFPGVSVPYGLYWSRATDLVYCASSRWDQVAVIAGDGSRWLGVLQVGDYPYSFAAAPRHRRLYVGHLNCNKVYVIRDEVGIAESGRYSGRPAWAAATVISASYEQKGGERARLVDIAGRPVAEIVPGVNDVRHLTPGVYAVVGRDGRHGGKVVKVR